MADREKTLGEIEHWFFDVYLPHWVSIGADDARDPAEVLNYWTPPLHVSTTALNDCLTEGRQVMDLLTNMQAPLKQAGYTHTNVLDRKITAYNGHSGSIDVIWSRCGPGDVEIQRRAAHFEIHRRDGNWHIVAFAGDATDKDRLDEIWATAS
ncbi:hypothetical protein RUESEDTHA_04123 [Ruegeria sp. THAF57]|uniref:DUF6841 family protein n=1 Tax=Ruegeria sp. THAF57 TaxID=2744555 RepID=UPI0015DFEBA5|nr:hypothetical protein [Ruegeria sp. THAF57]CAD0187211.1 hypothetical protein RUESEDTHA_04123 [Ruegeria sp. THAF57]